MVTVKTPSASYHKNISSKTVAVKKRHTIFENRLFVHSVTKQRTKMQANNILKYNINANIMLSKRKLK